MKKMLSLIFLAISVGFVVLIGLAAVRSTNETYVCSGNLTVGNKTTNSTLIKFNIEKTYSIFFWKEPFHTSINAINDYPVVYYAGSTLKSNKINWNETYYGKDISIHSETVSTLGNTLFDFDFESKIAKIINYNETGMKVNWEYSALCNNI